MEDQNTPREGGVRVTNADIYRLLLDTNSRVASVEQTVRDVVLPGIARAQTSADAAIQTKADKESNQKLADRIGTIEIRVYAILSGVIAAALGAKGLGVF